MVPVRRPAPELQPASNAAGVGRSSISKDFSASRGRVRRAAAVDKLFANGVPPAAGKGACRNIGRLKLRFPLELELIRVSALLVKARPELPARLRAIYMLC